MTLRIMTVDLEPDLGSDRCKSMEVVVPKLLDFFEQHHIKATFFVVTSLLERYGPEIKKIAQKHEIASHSHTHHWLNPVNAAWEIKKSKEVLEEHGIQCQGFRAPWFITTEDHVQLLRENGYKYDASLARFYPGRYSHLTLPGKPFYREGMLVFPMPTLIYPAINSGLPYLKLFHPLSRIFPKPYLFYLHPWEFLEKEELPANASLSNILLHRNCGARAWTIFQKYIENTKGEWVSCREWMKLNPQSIP